MGILSFVRMKAFTLLLLIICGSGGIMANERRSLQALAPKGKTVSTTTVTSTTTITTSVISSVQSYSSIITTKIVTVYPVVRKIIRIETVRLYSIRRIIRRTPKQIKRAKASGNKKLVIKLTKRAKAAARNKKDALTKINTSKAQKKVLAKGKSYRYNWKENSKTW